jgi:hypothetical protein
VLYIQSHTIEYSSIQLGGCVGENWYKQTTVEGVGYFVRDRVIINYVRYVDVDIQLMSFVANWKVTHDPGVKMAFPSERAISRLDAPD